MSLLDSTLLLAIIVVVLRLGVVSNLLRETVREWWADDASTLAAALAFYTVFSLAPLLIVAVALASVFFGREAARAEVLSQATDLVGQEGARVVESILRNTLEESPLATVVGLGAVLVGASAVFAHLQDSLNQLWEITVKRGKEKRAFLQKRLLAFAMVLVTGILVLASLVFNTILNAAAEFVGNYLHVSPFLIQGVNFVVSFLLLTGVFAVIFKVIPDATVAWQDVLIGGAATSLLFGIGRQFLGYYLASSSIGSAYGAAGSFAIVLVWVYYSAQVFFLGAEFTQVYARHKGVRVQPASYATRVSNRLGE